MKELGGNILTNVAEKLVKELNDRKIPCYIWCKATTGSVYIRFEDVRMTSVRLGDHEGRSQYKYKFNIRSDMKLSKATWRKDGDIWRYYVPLEKWTDLIPILTQRFEEIQKWKPSVHTYGIPKFKRYKS